MNPRNPLLIALSLGLIACDADAPSSDARVIDRFALSPGSQPVGITVDQATGQRFVLDAATGIERLDADGTLTNVWTPSIDAPITVNDLCAVTDTLFMVVGGGDGYMLDLDGDRMLNQHFCLEPGFMEEWGDRDPDTGEPIEPPTGEVVPFQQSLALSCDVHNNVIYAQPRTDLWSDTGFFDIVRSDVATYDLATGADLEWRQLNETTTNARGMNVDATGRVWLGENSQIVEVGDSGALKAVIDLAPFGVTSISGLTVDTHTNTLLVLDAISRELIEVAL